MRPDHIKRMKSGKQLLTLLNLVDGNNFALLHLDCYQSSPFKRLSRVRQVYPNGDANKVIGKIRLEPPIRLKSNFLG